MSLQLHSPDFAATLLSSSAHGQTFQVALEQLDGRFKDTGKGSRGASIKAYLLYLRHRMQAPQWVCVAAASAPGTSPQRRLALAELHEQLAEWERVFDLALDAFEAAQVTPSPPSWHDTPALVGRQAQARRLASALTPCVGRVQVGVLTQEPMLLLMRDANAAFVVLNDAMSNSLEAHYGLDLLAAQATHPLHPSFTSASTITSTDPCSSSSCTTTPSAPCTWPRRSGSICGAPSPPVRRPPPLTPACPACPIARPSLFSSIPPLPRHRHPGAHRLMDVQRGTQSLVAHAAAARSSSAVGEGAVGAGSLLLWPSVQTSTLRNATAQIESLQAWRVEEG